MVDTEIVTVANNAEDQYLTVQKVVDGNDEDKKDSFTFNLNVKYADGVEYTKDLADIDADGNIAITNNQNGTYTFTLKDGESVKVKLPKNCFYSVTETETDEYITDISGTFADAVKINKTSYPAFDSYTGVQDGKMEEDATVVFTNIAKKTLTISKEIDGVFADPNKEFEFTVTLTKNGSTQQYLKYTPEDAKVSYNAEQEIYTVKLKGGEAVTFTLPYGTDYTVEEAVYDEYVTKVNETAGNSVSGKLTTDTNADFLNIAKVTKLVVGKELTGPTASENKLFKFTVTLKNTDGAPFEGLTVPGVTETEPGIYSVELKGGETKTLYPLPYGCKYEVTEEDYTLHGYVTKLPANAAGELKENMTAEAVDEGILTAL